MAFVAVDVCTWVGHGIDGTASEGPATPVHFDTYAFASLDVRPYSAWPLAMFTSP